MKVIMLYIKSMALFNFLGYAAIGTITILTRLFCCLPASVSLVATGFDSPKPIV
jgi:hypothetical protein